MKVLKFLAILSVGTAMLAAPVIGMGANVITDNFDGYDKNVIIPIGQTEGNKWYSYANRLFSEDTWMPVGSIDPEDAQNNVLRMELKPSKDGTTRSIVANTGNVSGKIEVSFDLYVPMNEKIDGTEKFYNSKENRTYYIGVDAQDTAGNAMLKDSILWLARLDNFGAPPKFNVGGTNYYDLTGYNEWNHIKYEIDTAGKTGKLFINNIEATSWTLKTDNAMKFFRFYASTGISNEVLYMDNFSITAYTDKEFIEEELTKITVPELVEKQIDLPDKTPQGCSIIWESEPAGYVSGNSVIPGQDDTEIILTATVSYGKESVKQSYNVLVKGVGVMSDTQKVNYIASLIKKSDMTMESSASLKNDLSLNGTYTDYSDIGVEVVWKSDNPGISDDGKVTRTDFPQYGKITATVSLNEEKVEKHFYFTVAPKDATDFGDGCYTDDFDSYTEGESLKNNTLWNTSAGMFSAESVKNPRGDGNVALLTNGDTGTVMASYNQNASKESFLGKRYLASCDIYCMPDSSNANPAVFFTLKGADIQTRFGLNFNNKTVYIRDGSRTVYEFVMRRTPIEPETWMHIDIDLDTLNKTWVGYINGERIFEHPVKMPENIWLSYLPLRSVNVEIRGKGSVLVDNLAVFEYDDAVPRDADSDFSIEKITLSNGNGMNIIKFADYTTSAKIDVRFVKNREAQNPQASLIVAHYDDRGALVEIIKRDINELTTGSLRGYEDISINIPLEGDCSGHSLRAYVWYANDGSIKPVGEKYNLTREEIEFPVDILELEPNYEKAEDLGYTDSIYLSDDDRISAIFYDGAEYEGNTVKNFAYLGIPEGASAENPVPGIVLVHGGGGTAYKQWVKIWVDKGYAAIAMDLNGHIPTDLKINGNNLPKHAWAGAVQDNYAKKVLVNQNDIWMYQSVHAVVGAHNVLRSLDCVNNDNIGITGVSWGGIITSTVSGVDNRFKYAIPVYGCGFLHEAETYMGTNDVMTKEKQPWDPSNFIKKAEMPIAWISGETDGNFPVTSISKSAAAAKNGYLTIIPGMGHDHPVAWNEKMVYVYAEMFGKGENTLIIPGNVTVSGNTASVTPQIPAGKEIKDVRLYYSVKDIAYSGESALFSFVPTNDYETSGGTYSFDIPEGTKSFFINFTDSEGNVTTSELTKLN